MKHMKKLLGILLALVMVFAMATAVGAAETGDGKITINNATVGQTYTIYKILDLSFDEVNQAYTYTAAEEWKDFVENTANEYLATDNMDYVTWNKFTDTDPKEPIGVADFAALAKQNLTGKTYQGIATAAATTVTFENLELGYYLVDTTLGTVCSINTTNKEVEIRDKNEVPDIDKVVKEDSTGEFGTENTAQIGDTVEFKTTVHAKKGALNYVVHDKMSEGLTFKNDIVIKVGENTLNAVSDYTVMTDALDDDCDFHIEFAKTYLDTITTDTDIVITYSAILNENAVISTEVNTNDTKLDYSNTPGTDTEWKQTKTETLQFDIVKTKEDNRILDNAKFELYDAEEEGNQIKLVKVENGKYRVATTAETQAANFTSADIETVDGKAVIQGLDANTDYYLKETVAPDGYNKLEKRVKVSMEDENLNATVEAGVWTAGGVKVVNKAGTELPETGGIGTTIFYVVGTALVLGAAVLLVAKKRTANG